MHLWPGKFLIHTIPTSEQWALSPCLRRGAEGALQKCLLWAFYKFAHFNKNAYMYWILQVPSCCWANKPHKQPGVFRSTSWKCCLTTYENKSWRAAETAQRESLLLVQRTRAPFPAPFSLCGWRLPVAPALGYLMLSPGLCVHLRTHRYTHNQIIKWTLNWNHTS